MKKTYDKPAILGTTRIEPKAHSCQQGDEASVPEPSADPDRRDGSEGRRPERGGGHGTGIGDATRSRKR